VAPASGYPEVFLVAPDARLISVVVGAGEEVAGPPRPVADAEVSGLDAVDQDAIPVRVTLPDRYEAAAFALLDLDLHTPRPVRQGWGGRDVFVHLERAAAMVEGVVVALGAGGPFLVSVTAFEVQRDRVPGCDGLAARSRRAPAATSPRSDRREV
jgi:hypothetical protein